MSDSYRVAVLHGEHCDFLYGGLVIQVAPFMR